MVKLIPLSIVLATVVVPILYASRPRPAKQLRTVQITIAIAALAWALLNLYVYPRYISPE